MLKKKIWANFQRIIELFAQKIVTKLSNMGLVSGIRDPGSGKNPFRIPDPGVKKAIGSRIRIINTAFSNETNSHLFTFKIVITKNKHAFTQLQRSWVRSQHPLTEWNLRGGWWSSVEYSTKKYLKNPPPQKKTTTRFYIFWASKHRSWFVYNEFESPSPIR